ncbi:hypothetical protein [Victivallis lenta]|uniref:hypothetical protein n=1 Tax=Victivallis lenta TaxID=2606640 RepID=UPI0015A80E03|nr:hypothetical protein [Victivallis lenta]
MKRRLICCAAFLLLGAGAFCAGWFFREVSAFLEVEREASYAEARRLLLRCRLEIPGDLRALNVFSYDAGPDTACWFSCRIAPDEYEQLSKFWEVKAVAGKLPSPGEPPRPLVWWNPPEKLEETGTGRLWIGYDRASGVLYGYVFTI